MKEGEPMKIHGMLLLAMLFAGCGVHINRSLPDRSTRLNDMLERSLQANQFPGIQYVVVDSGSTLYEFTGGQADIGHNIPMRAATTMMAYSMTKTFTAAAVLQLAEHGKLSLDDSVVTHFPSTPYGPSMRIRHLVSQTSGIPDPIPLRWVHLASRHAEFNEDAALAGVLKENPKPVFPPGSKYAYSNISYWILGRIIEKASGQPYAAYMKEHIFQPLGVDSSEADFVIPGNAPHAKGYLRKYSFMNLFKGFIIADEFIGDYEGNWLHINDHHLNGPGFGGLVATAKSVARFLQDQLKERSVLFATATHDLFFARQSTNAGEPIAMTLGWHIGDAEGKRYYYKEGGGGGYHAEMRVYPDRRLATVIMVNETSSDCTGVQTELDGEFLR
jgi:CubicO group peptidase (beta-lactamase class C family)